ncbi:MAG: protein translocase subunit SecF [bacterium]|nr:protein translocase subunit SecF [bacterium]
MHKVYTIMFFFSIALTIAALGAFMVYGLNLGIDFRGGSISEIEFDNIRPSLEDIQGVLSDNISVKDIEVSSVGDSGILLKMGEISEVQHQEVLNKIRDSFDEPSQEKKFDSIGPVVGRELENKSVQAIIITLLAIIIYIAFVFRKMSVVLSPWAMGLAAMLALAHDIIIPVGVFSLLGHFYGVEISAVFMAALLTILGYSVSDTVVIFDRIRENVIRNRMRERFSNLVHTSIMQTLTRSLNTNFTALLSLVAIYLFGGESLRYFALALIIGIFLGAYSSIFVASPLLVWWSEWTKKNR